MSAIRPDIEMRVTKLISSFLKTTMRDKYSRSEVLRELRIPHYGPVITRRILDQLAITSTLTSEGKTTQRCTRISQRHIRCTLSACLKVENIVIVDSAKVYGPLFDHKRLAELACFLEADNEYPDRKEWARQHKRHFHAEFHALGETCERIQNYSPKEVSGVVELSIDVHPCTSCLLVIMEFREKYPKIELRVWYDQPLVVAQKTINSSD